MTLPFSLPDWLPWWVPIVVLVPALLYALVFLLMPFGLIGLKARMEAIEARLDEIQGEIRLLVLRMPEQRGTTLDWSDPPPPIPPARPEDDRPARPPIPPAPVQVSRRPPVEPGYRAPPDPMAPYGESAEPDDPLVADEAARRRAAVRPARAPRSEPRLDWPR